MKKSISTLFVLFAMVIPAFAHSGHNPSPHIHLSESISLSIVIIIASILIGGMSMLLIRKLLKKNQSHV